MNAQELLDKIATADRHDRETIPQTGEDGYKKVLTSLDQGLDLLDRESAKNTAVSYKTGQKNLRANMRGPDPDSILSVAKASSLLAKAANLLETTHLRPKDDVMSGKAAKGIGHTAKWGAIKQGLEKAEHVANNAGTPAPEKFQRKARLTAKEMEG